MPLPPALAAKLAKRGIINLPKEPPPVTEPEPATLAEEEIIAEDYDETPQQPDGYPRMGTDTFDQFQGYSGCPNKWNVYHECTPACRDQWKESKSVDREYDIRRCKMLIKYPLPEHWQEILDSGIGRYYYWNTDTDLVSWLPPNHPRCQVSRSAATLRQQMITERNSRVKEELDEKDDVQQQPQKESDHEDDDDDDESDEENDDDDDDSEEENDEKTSGDKKKRERKDSVDGDEMSDKSNDSSNSDSDSDSADHRDVSERRDKQEHNRDTDRSRGRERDRDRDRDRRGRRHTTKEELDPMDPASYGECPRGTWASGLPQRNEARTGADVTASGSLFQMRPYPSPGAVLRANTSVQGPNIGPKKT